MVNYDESQVTYIYELFYPDTKYYRDQGIAGKVFYVGKTVDVLRRAAQHDAKLSPLLRQLLELAHFNVADQVRLVPELPNGVPSLRADEFEGYFIILRKTLYDPSDPIRRYMGNQKHADHIAEVTSERYEELAEEIEDGVTMDLPQRWCEEIEQARAREKMYASLLEMFEKDESEQLKRHLDSVETALTISRSDRRELEAAMLPIVQFTELRQREYESMPFYQSVIKEDFVRDLNLIVAKVGNDEEDEGVRRSLRALRLLAKPTSEGGTNFDLPASTAATFLSGIVQVLEAREVANMPKSVAVNKILRVRDWTFNNQMKQPRKGAQEREKNPGTHDEALRGNDLTDWKAKHRGKDEADDVRTDFLMRNVSWWPKYAHTTQAETGANVAKKVNTMLIQGFRHRDEPEFPGSVQMTGAGGNRAAYVKLNNLVRAGLGSEKDLTIIVAPPLAPNRAKWYTEMYHTNKHIGERMIQEKANKRRACKEANTGQVIKRRKFLKTGSAASSSSTAAAPIAEEQDSDDDNDDNDSDDEAEEEAEEEQEKEVESDDDSD